VHPYAHPQHLKVLKHFVYIQYGCGMQSMRVCSLKHDTATSYRLGHAYCAHHPRSEMRFAGRGGGGRDGRLFEIENFESGRWIDATGM